jgi:hypothetical protein
MRITSQAKNYMEFDIRLGSDRLYSGVQGVRNELSVDKQAS